VTNCTWVVSVLALQLQCKIGEECHCYSAQQHISGQDNNVLSTRFDTENSLRSCAYRFVLCSVTKGCTAEHCTAEMQSSVMYVYDW
jgi:hypothetical protein